MPRPKGIKESKPRNRRPKADYDKERKAASARLAGLPVPVTGGLPDDGKRRTYDRNMILWCQGLCAQFGLTTEQLAVQAGVNISTFRGWLQRDEALAAAIKSGRESYLLGVTVPALRKLVEGGTKTKTVVLRDKDGGLITTTDTVEEVGPDPAMVKFSLLNLDPATWREKSVVDVELPGLDRAIQEANARVAAARLEDSIPATNVIDVTPELADSVPSDTQGWRCTQKCTLLTNGVEEEFEVGDYVRSPTNPREGSFVGVSEKEIRDYEQEEESA